MATEARIASILDDPVLSDRELLGSSTYQIAPLLNPSPSHVSSRPHPLEPGRPAELQHTSISSLKTSKSFHRDNCAEYGTPAKGYGHEHLLNKPTQQDGETKSRSGKRIAKAAVSIKEVLNEELSSDNPDESLQTEQVAGARKRKRAADAKSTDFVHLPKPPVKQQSQKAPRIPPLLQGLHEPPPNAGLFPPITETAFQDFLDSRIGYGATSKHDKPVLATPSKDQSSQLPVKKTPKALNAGKRNKWTEEETRDLLMGVARFGIGSWKKILSHPDYNFHGRSSVDLKDRFRNCCPKDYLKETRFASRDDHTYDREVASNGNCKLPPASSLSKILAPESKSSERVSKEVTPRKSTRSHRKAPSDLLALGIDAPFKKAKRRPPLAFSKAEDAALLAGFERYGASWREIRDDSSLCLSKRKPTDLRDRLRNKFPEKYADAGLKGRPEIPKPQQRAGVCPMSEQGEGPSPALCDIAKDVVASTEHSKSVADVSRFQTASSTTTSAPPSNIPSFLNSTIEPSSLLLQRHLIPLGNSPSGGIASSEFAFLNMTNPFTAATEMMPVSYQIHTNHNSIITVDRPATPIMLDRSIFEWANQNLGSFSVSGSGLGALSNSTGPSKGSGSSGGAAAPALPLEATHINPLVTWKPASGLF